MNSFKRPLISVKGQELFKKIVNEKQVNEGLKTNEQSKENQKCEHMS